MDKRKLIQIFILLFFLVSFGNTCGKEDSNQGGSSNGGGGTPEFLFRGINIGNALEAPNEGDWGVTIKEEYFTLIKNKGFDFVRIPIRWSAHAEVDSPYTIDSKFFERIDWVIDKARSKRLSVIINMHHYEEIFSNPSLHHSRFLAIWKQIAERYADYGEFLYFEILNEPHGNLTADLWNQYLKEAIDTIRQTNPERIIIVGPVNWNSYAYLNSLSIPENDSNIIVTFHYYDPFQFTHQGAEWVDGSEAWLGTKWTGTEQEKKAIRDAFDKAKDWAEQHNRKILLGEFGAYRKADMESRVRWTSFVAREAEARNMPWAYWEFCSGFGIYDPSENKWRDSLVEALIPLK
ncbi:MAG: glycoside hydrolase family 5 protein [candidate division WOR-3 bacterium]